tara:strand:+ start:263 stop:481 length:219 start_codon:yes stop_codon:yes gene_type:complete
MIKKNKIKIKINGKNLSIKSNTSVNDQLLTLKIPIKKVAIEINRKILDKKKLKNTLLKNGDKIEIVHFIGGG